MLVIIDVYIYTIKTKDIREFIVAVFMYYHDISLTYVKTKYLLELIQFLNAILICKVVLYFLFLSVTYA